jgi:hypothetical protein
MTDQSKTTDLVTAFRRAREFIEAARRRGDAPTASEIRAIYRMAAAPGGCIVFRCTFRNVSTGLWPTLTPEQRAQALAQDCAGFGPADGPRIKQQAVERKK